MKHFFLGLVLLLGSMQTLAQQDVIELARADIRSGRLGMVTAAMNLSAAQQEIFWPIYRDYAIEQEALLDKRIVMLREFVAGHEKMTAAAARSLAEQSFAIQRDRVDRRERYFAIMADTLGPVLAARFIQVDTQISTLMDFELMRNTPLIEAPVAAVPAK